MQLCLEEVAVTLGAARDAARRSGRGFVNRMLQRGWLVHSSHTSSDRAVCTVRGHQQMATILYLYAGSIVYKVGMVYRVVQKNSCMFECSRPLSAH